MSLRYQSKSESQLSEYKNTLKIKEFELERLTLLYDEISTKFGNATNDNDKNAKKLEVLFRLGSLFYVLTFLPVFSVDQSVVSFSQSLFVSRDISLSQ